MRNKNVLFIKTKLSDKHEALRRYNWADGALWCVSGEKRFLLVPSLKCECPKRTELKGSFSFFKLNETSVNTSFETSYIRDIMFFQPKHHTPLYLKLMCVSIY